MTEQEVKDVLDTFREQQGAVAFNLQAWLRSSASAALVRLADVREREAELLRVILVGVEGDRRPGFQRGHPGFRKRDNGASTSEGAEA